jgi:type IV secretory pathway VirB10-like protein
VWQRIIFPDGASIVIDNLPVTDTGGYAGLSDDVDLHTYKLLKGIALATVRGVGRGTGSERASAVTASRGGAFRAKRKNTWLSRAWPAMGRRRSGSRRPGLRARDRC